MNPKILRVSYQVWLRLTRKRRRHWYRQLDRQSPPDCKLNPEWMNARYEVHFDQNSFEEINIGV